MSNVCTNLLQNYELVITLLLVFYLGGSHASDGICRLNEVSMSVMNTYIILTFILYIFVFCYFLSLHVHFNKVYFRLTLDRVLKRFTTFRLINLKSWSRDVFLRGKCPGSSIDREPRTVIHVKRAKRFDPMG